MKHNTTIQYNLNIRVGTYNFTQYFFKLIIHGYIGNCLIWNTIYLFLWNHNVIGLFQNNEIDDLFLLNGNPQHFKFNV